jgi:hypothetical protein
MKYFLCLGLLFLSSGALACDVCGNGASGFHMGAIPSLSKDFVGLRYRTAAFHSHLESGRLFRTKEIFRTTELWYRRGVGKRWQAMAFVPYHINEQRMDNGLPDMRRRGLGDVLLIAGYQVWLRKGSRDRNGVPEQQLWINGGIKLPSGQNDVTKDEQDHNPNLQLGTGSVDAMISAMYTMRRKSSGITADLTFRKNHPNRNGFVFGNRLTSNVYLYFNKRVKSFTVMPITGLSIDASDRNVSAGVIQYESGGHILSGTAGINVGWGKATAGVTWQLPIQQNLFGGHQRTDGSAMVQVAYLFR